VITKDVRRAAAADSLFYPDPASVDSCSIGAASPPAPAAAGRQVLKTATMTSLG
jgi:hypothetical protein